jgi:hypothetical protein
MSHSADRFSSPFGELFGRIRALRMRASERRAHDEAMLDRGIADDHAAAIARALSRGEPGCYFCD